MEQAHTTELRKSELGFRCDACGRYRYPQLACFHFEKPYQHEGKVYNEWRVSKIVCLPCSRKEES